MVYKEKVGHHVRYGALYMALITAGIVWAPVRAAPCGGSYQLLQNPVSVSLGTCQKVYFANPAVGNLFVNNDTGTTLVASGDDIYTDQTLTNGGPSRQLSTFIAVYSLGVQSTTAITLQGLQEVVGASGNETGVLLQVSPSAPARALLSLNAADLRINLPGLSTTGIVIAGNSNSTAAAPYPVSTALSGGSRVSIDATQIGMQITNGGEWSGLDPTGALTIGAITRPDLGIQLVSAGRFASSAPFSLSANQKGIFVSSVGTLFLDGVSPSTSAINVYGWNHTGPNDWEAGIDYINPNPSLPPAVIKNLTINMLDAGVNGFIGNGYGVNLRSGSLSLDNVTIQSANIDGAAVTGIGGNLGITALTVDTTGKGTAGIQSEPNSGLSLTLGGATSNTITTRGNSDATVTSFGNFKYAAGVSLLGGSIDVAHTSVATYGLGAYGIYLSAGSLSAHQSAGAGTELKSEVVYGGIEAGD